MLIKIAARKSDLARLQAYRVGQALQARIPQVQVEYFFSTSLGDQNLETPLWQMPEKGVFTEDLTKKLMQGECDLVVHSWKDLPTEERVLTEIVATLPRADARDLILFRESSLKSALADTYASDGQPASSSEPHQLRVFSSSPRRILNVGEFLKWALPFQAEIEFKNIRGNIPTRVRKLMSGDADALVLAKAAVDRLLASDEEEFAETRQVLRSALSECRWMITPLIANPSAPAQGALAIEILKSRQDLRELLAPINCPQTFKNAQRERAILQKYGGGCHQKIGVACLSMPYGEIEIERGEKPQETARVLAAGEGPSPGRLDSVKLYTKRNLGTLNSVEQNQESQIVSDAQIFPLRMSDSHFYDRESRSVDFKNLENRNLWVAKAEAWPADLKATPQQVVWCAGLTSWQKLAEKGVWVNGSQEGLGEDAAELYDINTLIGAAPEFLKLSHNESQGLGEMDLCVTYDLHETANAPDLTGKTHFYWASFSSFRRAVATRPEIRAAQHACGPGHTYKQLRDFLQKDVSVFLSHQGWLKSLRRS